MNKTKPALAVAALLLMTAPALHAQQSREPSTQPFAPRENITAPVVLCIDDKPSGGQPSAQAYANAAANGFRSVLTLRAANDHVNPPTERLMVEQNKLRYFNIPPSSKLPRRERVEEFLRLARDPANQPMLINCAFAERVAPLMMIFRIVEQGWSQERALKEATASGLKADPLKKFTADYLAHRKPKPTDTRTDQAGH
jgi:protein tyrosine phosphatase (PTP) superfamily phosphohydrolase (DUF442 family)